MALKIRAPTLAGDADLQRRFISESLEAAAIDDPHIVPVFAAGEADGVLFIAMRYVAGGDAHSLLYRERPLPPGRVAAKSRRWPRRWTPHTAPYCCTVT